MEESIIIRRNPPDEEENSSRRDEEDSEDPFSHCILFSEAEKEEMQVSRKLTERSNEEMLLSQDDVKIPES